MQITSDTTGMRSGITVFTDKDGRDHCIVVVKGTFVILPDGEVSLAEEQEPLVYADQHYGDPGTTSIRYECDFAPFKPRADIIVNGFAYSPTAAPIREMVVGLAVGSAKKVVRVYGNRYWDTTLVGLRASDPEPFTKMPLIFERAFGGSDQTDPDPKYWGSELRNLVGIGFYMGADVGSVVGRALPNLEEPRHPIVSCSDRPPPAAFGGLARGWQPRIKFAGTYGQRWLDERFPFLPEDFDPQYFQSAPADQQVPYLQGGELIRCANMTPEGGLTFTVPRIEVPVTYRFRDRDILKDPNLDTLIIEPDRRRFIATWRTMVPLGRKIHDLREIAIGPKQLPVPTRTANGKPHFRSIDDLIAWKRNPDNLGNDE